MNKHDLLPLVVSGFFFNDIQNFKLIMPIKASTTEVCINFDRTLSPIITPNTKPLSKEEEAVFSRLNEVWGDDDDGAYQRLYQRHKNLQSHAL